VLCDLLLDIPKHRGWRDGLEKEGGFGRKETVDRGKGDVPREDVERVAVRDVRIRGSSIVTLTDAVAERVVSSKDKVTVAFALLVSENSNRLLAVWTLSSTTDDNDSMLLSTFFYPASLLLLSISGALAQQQSSSVASTQASTSNAPVSSSVGNSAATSGAASGSAGGGGSSSSTSAAPVSVSTSYSVRLGE
jgi:hypothetical protein